MSAKRARTTPIRTALLPESALQKLVQDGLGGVDNAHRAYIDDELRTAFADSLALDDAMLPGREEEHRWDYLLGHAASGSVIGLEPHSAKQDQVSTVVKKREAAREQLKGHLRPGQSVSRWCWVASGDVHFANTERVRFQLDQNGIDFVGKRLLPKHLPSTSTTTPKKR
jgi:hypothetical protein